MDQGRRRGCRRRRRKELQTKTNQEQEDSLSFGELVAAAAAFTLSSSLCLFGCWIVPFRVEAVVFCSTKEREEDEEELHYFTWNNRTCEGWEGLSAGIASPPPPLPSPFVGGVQCGGKRDESKKKKVQKLGKGWMHGEERKGKKERKKWEEEVLLCCLLATGGACWRRERLFCVLLEERGLFCVFFCCVGVASSQLTWYSQIIYKNPPCNHPLPSSLLLVALLDEHPSSHPEMHY